MIERYNRSNEFSHNALLAFVKDPKNERFFRRISSLAGDETFDSLERLLNAQFFFYYYEGAFLSPPDALVGVFNYDAAAGTAEVGCCVAAQLSHLGVATQALGQLAARLFYGNVFMEKLTATCLREDTHSRHVLEKTGWVLEGVFERNVYFQGEIKDEVRYRLFREEYEQRYGDRFAYWKEPQLRDQAGGGVEEPAAGGVSDTNELGQTETTVEAERG